MDNHPIPQDVTGFQFRLIGDMTIKQFAYVAAGAVVGWFFLFILPMPAFIKLPLSLGSVLFGIALAFFPIAGRPLDQMTINFIKDIFAPNQYLYHKRGELLLLMNFPKHHITKPTQAQIQHTSRSQDLETLLNQIHNQPKTNLDEKEAQFLNSLSSAFNGQTPASTQNVVVMPVITPTIPSINNHTTPQAPEPIQPEKTEEKPPEQKNDSIKQLPVQEKPAPVDTQAVISQPSVVKKPAQADQLVANQSTKVQESIPLSDAPITIQTKPQPQTAANLKPTAHFAENIAAFSAPPPDKQLIQELTSLQNITAHTGASQKAVPGAPFIPDVPNLVSGIVKDPRGNILNNILIEIKDKEGNPVRAFKTNALGQFASATPLPNGSFTIEFEDPKGEQRFAPIEFTLSGVVLMPFEVISTDAREDLRRSLFEIPKPTKPN